MIIRQFTNMSESCGSFPFNWHIKLILHSFTMVIRRKLREIVQRASNHLSALHLMRAADAVTSRDKWRAIKGIVESVREKHCTRMRYCCTSTGTIQNYLRYAMCSEIVQSEIQKHIVCQKSGIDCRLFKWQHVSWNIFQIRYLLLYRKGNLTFFIYDIK